MGNWVKKDRPLTAILAAKGDETLRDSKVRAKDALASHMWTLALTGKVSFPDADETSGFRTLKASVKDWKETAQWLYQHIDGPVRVDGGSGDSVSKALSETPLEELQKVVQGFRSAAKQQGAAEDGTAGIDRGTEAGGTAQ